MLICLDFDDTFTEDPLLWSMFTQNAKERGHTVIFVTGRSPEGVPHRKPNLGNNSDIEAYAQREGIRIVYCNLQPKRACVKAAGYETKNSIWIDDNPFMVDHHYDEKSLVVIGG